MIVRQLNEYDCIAYIVNKSIMSEQDALWLVVPILLIFSFVIRAAFLDAYVDEKQKKKVWTHFAAQYHLTFKLNRLWTTIYLYGQYRNRAIKLKSYRAKAGRTERLKIELAVRPQVNLGLLIRRYTMQDSLTEMYGHTAEHTQRVFGQRYVVEGFPKPFITGLFEETDIGVDLVRTTEANPLSRLEVTGYLLKYDQSYWTDPEAILTQLDQLCDLAKAVEAYKRG